MMAQGGHSPARAGTCNCSLRDSSRVSQRKSFRKSSLYDNGGRRGSHPSGPVSPQVPDAGKEGKWSSPCAKALAAAHQGPTTGELRKPTAEIYEKMGAFILRQSIDLLYNAGNELPFNIAGESQNGYGRFFLQAIPD